jgi:hypothetical protein
MSVEEMIDYRCEVRCALYAGNPSDLARFWQLCTKRDANCQSAVRSVWKPTRRTRKLTSSDLRGRPFLKSCTRLANPGTKHETSTGLKREKAWHEVD